MIKRAIDIIVSLVGIILLLPLFIIISIFIKLDSRGPVLYIQRRVGLYARDFGIIKFRTMRQGSDKMGVLTVGGRDSRITKAGYWLRKTKLDEMPQLWNVLTGCMSLVGPRPEVRKYVNIYTDRQREVLTVKPGITDLASIRFIDENELLLKYANPEEGYITEILPMKLQINLDYVRNQTLFFDLKIILLTLKRIVKRDKLLHTDTAVN